MLLAGALKTISTNSNISRIGIIQGLAEGSLQTFIFLWSPTLRQLASSRIEHGEPAYGLIFGAFMASAVVGGSIASLSRKKISSLLISSGNSKMQTMNDDATSVNEGLNPVPVHILCSLCYALSSILLFVPCVIQDGSSQAFSLCLISFILYEFLVGIYVPSEGILRSIYMPTESMCSTINMLRIITNLTVAISVFSTTFVPIKASFAALSGMMISAAVLQLSLISKSELKEDAFKAFHFQIDYLAPTFVFLALVEVVLAIVNS